jgi:nicotinic acid phosphoribosyltransferase
MASEPENQIYKDMINHITEDLANETKIKIKDECCRDVDMVLMTKDEALEHLKLFKKEVEDNEGNYRNICNLFRYNPSSVYEVEPEPEPANPDLISATTYNDYYKFTMAPVIGAVEDHRPNVHVTFAVDLRDAGIANDMLDNKVGKDGIGYHAKLSSNLTKLAARKFNRKILTYLNTNHALSFGSIHKSYWSRPENSNKIFGESDKPNTLLGTSVIEVQTLQKIIMCLGKIQKYDPISGEKTDKERDIVLGDFHTNTIVLNGKFIPHSKKDSTVKLIQNAFPGSEVESFLRCVVLSMYVGPDAKSGVGKKKLHIEATGKWRNVSWLETSMMQTVYETAHTEDLAAKEVSYGQWLAQALFRTYLGMKYLETNPGAMEIKVALFSGRRTGGFLYNLLQVYLWSKFSTPLSTGGRNMGTSSVDAWYQLNLLKTQSKLDKETVIASPAGTHAHELSMVLSSIYADLDNNEHKLVITQVLGHYLYYRLTHQESKAPMPMLPDTLGTESFLRAANVIKVPKNDDSAEMPFLSIIASARQDSGELAEFIKRMAKYSYSGGKMASEIDNIPDFNTAQGLGYGLAGVGGALGDSEKAWNTTGERLKFTASMAVKAVRVFFDGKLTENSFPVKTGDGGAVKVTADTTLDVKLYKSYVDNANEVREANKYSDIISKTPHVKLVYNPDSHPHKALNESFKTLVKGIIESSGQFSSSQGGRRMKSNMRQINKTLSKFRKNKRITKSIRKTRRSYRRY